MRNLLKNLMFSLLLIGLVLGLGSQLGQAVGVDEREIEIELDYDSGLGLGKDELKIEFRGLELAADDYELTADGLRLVIKKDQFTADNNPLKITIDSKNSNYSFDIEGKVSIKTYILEDADFLDENDEYKAFEASLKLYQQTYIRVKTVFPAYYEESVAKLNGVEIPAEGLELALGNNEAFEITSHLDGHRLVVDLFKQKDLPFRLEYPTNDKLRFSRYSGEGVGEEVTIYLSFGFDGSDLVYAGDSKLGDEAIKLIFSQEGKELDIQNIKMDGVTRTKINVVDGSYLMPISGPLTQRLVFEPLIQLSNGSYLLGAEILAGYEFVDMTVDQLNIGDTKITGHAMPGGKVYVDGIEVRTEVVADSEGKFTVELTESVAAGHIIEIYAVNEEEGQATRVQVIEQVKETEREAIRIFGSNRFRTAVEVSKKLRAEIDRDSRPVILASGITEVDALSAGPLAIELGAPILLVGKDMPEEVLEEIVANNPEDVYIIGGPAAVSNDIGRKLGEDYEVTRLWGDNRYDTSLAVAEFLIENMEYENAVLASGHNTADALAVSGYAAENKAAILLTGQARLPANMAEMVASKDIGKVDIVGGTNSISALIQRSLGSKFGLRMSGADRFATAKEIAEKTYGDIDRVVVVNGTEEASVDALAAAPYAAFKKAPIVLTDSGRNLRVAAANYIDKANPAYMTVIGGPNSVNEEVLIQFEKLSPVVE